MPNTKYSTLTQWREWPSDDVFMARYLDTRKHYEFAISLPCRNPEIRSFWVFWDGPEWPDFDTIRKAYALGGE